MFILSNGVKRVHRREQSANARQNPVNSEISSNPVNFDKLIGMKLLAFPQCSVPCHMHDWGANIYFTGSNKQNQ